jgi:glyoxylase-like metal-dependent hydrolase (beta-lactamase superfamily II)
MPRAFASEDDLKPKPITFQRLSKNAWAFTAEGDPNTGVIVGDDGVMVIDAQATPVMAREVIRRIRRVTAKPIRYLVLSHYHAVRVLGAAAYRAEQVIASSRTLGLIRERGRQDMASEIGRFPRLFRGAGSIPGLTWPTLVFRDELTLWMGKLEVRILHPGPGHTGGDTVVWIPSQRVLFSGDLVEYEAGIYTGDAHLEAWPRTLEKLRARSRPRPRAQDPRGLRARDSLHAALRASTLRRGALGREAEEIAEGDLRDDTSPDGSALCALSHLRALPAVRRLARLRRGARHPAPADLDREARPRTVAVSGLRRGPAPHEVRSGT